MISNNNNKLLSTYYYIIYNNIYIRIRNHPILCINAPLDKIPGGAYNYNIYIFILFLYLFK